MTPNEEKRATKPNETDKWTKKWHRGKCRFSKTHKICCQRLLVWSWPLKPDIITKGVLIKSPFSLQLRHFSRQFFYLKLTSFYSSVQCYKVVACLPTRFLRLSSPEATWCLILSAFSLSPSICLKFLPCPIMRCDRSKEGSL